jgi:tRNA nucleotidyltransferase/poly(A) polymerase
VALKEDLARRDFTVNAMALPLDKVMDPDWKTSLVDPFGGREDLESRLLRAVGDPLQRFAEDGLRSLRACRFASQLGFRIEPATLEAIPRCLDVARKVSIERVFAEMDKLLRGGDPGLGLRFMERTGLLDLWIPELRPMMGCLQNRHHGLDVWEHTLLALQAEGTARPEMRWGLLLHDVGKPPTRTIGEDGEAHFFGHESVSADMAVDILRRLRASSHLRDAVRGLILHHREHPSESWSDAAYRRLLKRLSEAGVTPEAWQAFRLADQYGKGWRAFDRAPNGKTGSEWWQDVEEEWRTILARLDAVRASATTTKKLVLDGHALMAMTERKAGPWLAKLQHHLLEAVLEDPANNDAEILGRLAKEWLERNDES